METKPRHRTIVIKTCLSCPYYQETDTPTQSQLEEIERTGKPIGGYWNCTFAFGPDVDPLHADDPERGVHEECPLK